MVWEKRIKNMIIPRNNQLAWMHYTPQNTHSWLIYPLPWTANMLVNHEKENY
jgi:hypothetical protein